MALPPIGIVALGLGGTAHQMLMGMPFRLAPEIILAQRSGGKKFMRVDWTQFPKYMRPDEHENVDEPDENEQIDDGMVDVTLTVASKQYAFRIKPTPTPIVSVEAVAI